MNRLNWLILLSTLFFGGCASNPMTISNKVSVEAPMQNESQVVFMRDSFLGSAINASLYDVTDKEPKFIGIIADGTKIPYNTSPGRHTFMVVSEAADFMRAELSAGKTYYTLVTPRMGAWKARFSLWPIKKAVDAEYSTESKDFKNWQKDTKIVELSAKAKAWYGANKSSVMKKREKYWPVWQEKSNADKAKRTLNPEDGM